MISFRKADLINRVTDQNNQAAKANAERELALRARQQQDKIYDYDFSGVVIDGRTYSGTISVLYSADFIKGSPGSYHDPGDPDQYAIAIADKVILPGNAAEESDGPDRVLWDAKELDRLRELLEAAIPDETIEEAIANSLHERDRDSN